MRLWGGGWPPLLAVSEASDRLCGLSSSSLNGQHVSDRRHETKTQPMWPSCWPLPPGTPAHPLPGHLAAQPPHARLLGVVTGSPSPPFSPSLSMAGLGLQGRQLAAGPRKGVLGVAAAGRAEGTPPRWR